MHSSTSPTLSTPYELKSKPRLLTGTSEYFPLLLKSLEEARYEIFLETYIFSNGNVGRQVQDALVRAASRGVKVRVMVDGYGSVANLLTLEKMREAGVEFLVYRPEIGKFNFRRYRLRRLHRKIALIDRQVALLGGLNIEDEADIALRMKSNLNFRTLDFAVQVSGPVVADIVQAVWRLWVLVSWAHWRQRPAMPFIKSLPEMKSCAMGAIDAVADGEANIVGMTGTNSIMGGQAGESIRLLLRDNLRHRRSIEESYFSAINLARQEIILASAYFFPRPSFCRTLCAAAQRGVKVILLLQGVADHPFARWASQHFYARILADGVRIFEYKGGLLHAKVAVVDDNWCTVGSSNIDPFSLLVARESNLEMTDRQIVHNLKHQLLQALENNAVEMVPETWKNRPWWHRAINKLSYTWLHMVLVILGLKQLYENDF